MKIHLWHRFPKLLGLLLLLCMPLMATAQVSTQDVHKPQFAVGDTWSYRAFDLLTKAESFRFTNTVKEVNAAEFWIYGDRTLKTNQRFWWSGDMTTNRFIAQYAFDEAAPRQIGPKRRDSSASELQWPLIVGKSWKSIQPWTNAEGQSGRNEVELRVEAAESVTTPAGVFQTMKVVSSGYWFNETRGGSGRLESIFWISPTAKREVRSESRIWTGTGRYFETSGNELLSFSVKGGEADQ
jgi:hypothetical protein